MYWDVLVIDTDESSHGVLHKLADAVAFFQDSCLLSVKLPVMLDPDVDTTKFTGALMSLIVRLYPLFNSRKRTLQIAAHRLFRRYAFLNVNRNNL